MQTILDPRKGERGSFCELLRKVQDGREPIDALFNNQTFRERLHVIISAHRQKPEDAEELANDVRVKVWRYINGFTPDYTCDYGRFFGWLRSIARNSFLDTLKDDLQYGNERPEDLNSKDPSIDIEGQLLYKERLQELESCINALPEKERLATTYHVLRGLPSRITAELLTKAGFECTHVTVLKWVRDGLKTYFPNAKGFSLVKVQRRASKSTRVNGNGNKQSSSLKRNGNGKVAKPFKKEPAKS